MGLFFWIVFNGFLQERFSYYIFSKYSEITYCSSNQEKLWKQPDHRIIFANSETKFQS